VSCCSEMSVDDKSRHAISAQALLQSSMTTHDQSYVRVAPKPASNFGAFLAQMDRFPFRPSILPPLPPAGTSGPPILQEILRLDCQPPIRVPLEMCGRGLKVAHTKIRAKLRCKCTVGVVDDALKPLQLKADKTSFEIEGAQGSFQIDLRRWVYKLPRGHPCGNFRIEATNELQTIKYVSNWFVVNARPKIAPSTPPPALALDPQMNIGEALLLALPDHTTAREWAKNLGGVEKLTHLRTMDRAGFKQLLILCAELPALQSALRKLRAESPTGQAMEESKSSGSSSVAKRKGMNRENVHPNVVHHTRSHPGTTTPGEGL